MARDTVTSPAYRQPAAARAPQVWRNFAKPADFAWGRRIVIMFSVCNAVGNVVSPIASEWLHRRGKLRRARYTAAVLGFMALVFFWLAAFTISPALRHGPWACDAAYIGLMATVGFGYGSFLTLFPTLVADTYGLRNFGTYVSYVQVGSALASLAIPAATSSVRLAHAHAPVVRVTFVSFVSHLTHRARCRCLTSSASTHRCTSPSAAVPARGGVHVARPVQVPVVWLLVMCAAAERSARKPREQRQARVPR